MKNVCNNQTSNTSTKEEQVLKYVRPNKDI